MRNSHRRELTRAAITPVELRAERKLIGVPVIQTELDHKQQPLTRLHIRITPLVLLGFSLFYFADVFLRASEKYFWYDELFTVYLCRLPLHSLWQALQAGIDSNPPLFYLLTKASNAVFGEGLIATRLPEIIGFWLFCLCLFRFVSRRVGAVGGFTAMLLPIFTGAFYYAYDARAHGLVLGFCGLALVCWQMSLEQSRRGRWLNLFSVSLFGAFMIHCYALTIAVPFGIAELIGGIRSRRVQWQRWASLVAPVLAACIAYVPLLRGFRAMVKDTMFLSLSPLIWPQVHSFYAFLLGPCMLIVLLALIMLAFKVIETVRAARMPQSGILPIPAVELVLAVSFAALPVFGLLLAKAMQSPFYDRYFLSALAGLCILTALAAGVGRPANWVALTLAGVLACSAAWQFSALLRHRVEGIPEILNEPSSGFAMNISLAGPLEQYSFLQSEASKGERIVVLWPIEFLYLVNYAPKLAPQLYYLQRSENDSFYRVFERFQAWSPVKYTIMPQDEFLRSTPHFLLYGTDSVAQLAQMIQAGATMKSVRVSDGHFLAEMESKGMHP